MIRGKEMLNRLLLLLLIMSFGWALCCCKALPGKRETVGEIIRPEEVKQELNIIVLAEDVGNTKWDILEKYKKDFENQYGVCVNYVKIGDMLSAGGSSESFEKKLASKLYLEGGPELIFFNGSMYIDALIKQKAVIDIKNKISNVDSIYPSLVGNELYCVPIAVTYRPIVLKRKVLEVLDIKEPEYGWDREEYYNIREKWLDKSVTTFNYYEYYDIINKYLYSVDIFNEERRKADINTSQMKSSIKKIRAEVFSGKYKLKSNYKYENYYNMLYEHFSEEYKEDFELRNSEAYRSQAFRNRSYEHSITPLKAKDTSYKISSGEAIFMPQFSDDEQVLIYKGFLVNRNGKNIGLACEFINGLLSKEVQQQIYEDFGDLYPVNREIEDTIRDIEAQAELDERAIELKDYILDSIKSGCCRLWTDYSRTKESELLGRLKKDLLKYILTDSEYTDEELSKELQAIEDNYNIWLNE